MLTYNLVLLFDGGFLTFKFETDKGNPEEAGKKLAGALGCDFLYAETVSAATT